MNEVKAFFSLTWNIYLHNIKMTVSKPQTVIQAERIIRIDACKKFPLHISRLKIYLRKRSDHPNGAGKRSKKSKERGKMRKTAKRFLSCILAAVMILTWMLPVQVEAVKNKTACYVSNYKKWNQGESAYSEMREVGCLITAQAKMLYEANINREAFNPDVWYEWLWANKYLKNPPSNLIMMNFTGPVKYASSRGKKMEYLGFWKADDTQLWSNIRAGYYTIVDVSGHYVMIDNATSLSTGKLYIYDSYSRGSKNPISWPVNNQFTWNDSSCLLSKYSTRRGGHVYKSLSSAAVVPGAPSGVRAGAADFGIGDAVNVSWNASAGASQYQVRLVCSSDSAYDQTKTVGGNSASFALNAPGSYQVTVSASNSAGTSQAVSSQVFTVHPNVTVTYEDWDGTVIGNPQSVKYGGNAVQPAAPSREGYTFQSWSSDGKKVTGDAVITAEYRINSYNVKFVDDQDQIIGNVQKVEYGSSAAAPTDLPEKKGYVFAGWSTDDYKNVKESMTVKAVYVWENANLPIYTEIVSAVRNTEATGYNVSVKITNFPDDFTVGKLVAVLKTKEGKMVASETRSIYLPATKEATENFTILYSGLATRAEVSMIGMADDNTSGTPKSKAVSKSIDVGNEWSDWSETVPENTQLTQESRTEYRYKDKTVIKAVTAPTTPSGYTLTKTEKTGTYTDWSAWSGYSRTAAASNTLVNVGTTTGYRYYAFVCSSCGTRDPYSGTCSGCGKSGLSWQEEWGTASGYNYGYTKVNSAKGKIWWQNKWWYFELNGASNGQGGYGQPTCTLYRTRTRQEYSNYTYWQTSFSSWQPEAVEPSDSRQVETRTVYRFKSDLTEVPCYNYKRYKYENVNNGKTVYSYTSVYADSMDYPGEWEYNRTFTPLEKVATVDDGIDLYNGTGENSWYRADVNAEGESTVFETASSLEDTQGTKRVLEGKAEGCGGKTAALMIYKGQNADPLASQIEYIGQTVIGEDGTYRFDYITKEEPTASTGDFVITLGIEGSTNYITLGKIEAPKEVFTVDFADEDGQPIGEQKKVVCGGTVEAPDAPEKEGYVFAGWDTGLRNIRENMVITAQYKKKTCTVIFVDWDSTSLSIQEFEYGDVLDTDVLPEKAGQRFDRWLDENGNEAVHVTGNMIVQASYVDTKYVVTFLDWDGNVIKEQEADYGSSVDAPQELESPGEGKVFTGWDNYEGISFVSRSVVVSPAYEYVATTDEPLFTVASGNYETEQKVGLYALNADVDIYYMVKPLTEIETGASEYVDYEAFQLYRAPITITESSVLYAYAASENANNSEVAVSEIVIAKKNDPTPDPGKGNSGNDQTGGQKPDVQEVKLSRPVLKRVKNLKGRKAQLTWSKVKNASGYQITYALNSKFSKGKKNIKIKKSSVNKKVIGKLKKNKRYYFKIRAYKNGNGTKVYSDYSKTKKIIIKK